MLTLSPSLVTRYTVLQLISVMAAVGVLGTAAFSAARGETATVRYIGNLDSVITPGLLKQVNLVPFTRQQDSSILLQGETMSQLQDGHKQELRETYQAGHTIVLLDAAMAHIEALHGVIGEGVTYRSKNAGVVMAYALRREHHIPTATLLTYVPRSPLRTPSGDPDPHGLLDEELAFNRAVDRTVTELSHLPKVSMPGPSPGANQPIAWQGTPLQTTTFALNGPGGVYNTPINVYALHRCLDGTDHYVVTAGADWTATNAQWQDASTNFDAGGPSTLSCNKPISEWPCAPDELVINWQDNDRTYCSSDGFNGNDSNICRYINYPMSYALQMVPLNTGTVAQTAAAPAATQGQQASVTSGFSFTIGGTVNVSTGSGPTISASATWNNTTTTTVPPLIVEAGNTGPNNEGAFWSFKYCTTGLEPDPGTDCTSHVQMVKDVCQAQLGDPSSGSNPQQGQTPDGKLSNVAQSAHWTAGPDTRVDAPNFEIEVAFTANLAYTTAHLGTDASNASGRINPDPDVGCNEFGCACVSETQPVPASTSVVFKVPFPSTACQ
jgi:hypothetical protein